MKRNARSAPHLVLGDGARPSFAQVLDERGKTDVEDRAEYIFQAVMVLRMGVPEWIIRGIIAGFTRPVAMHPAAT